MKKKKLPDSFCIKWTDDPRWSQFIMWLNEKYGTGYHGGTTDVYYGITVNDNPNYCANPAGVFENILTLDEFFAIKEVEKVVSHWFYVPKTDLKKIYDVACMNWKAEILTYAQRDPFDAMSRLSVEEVDEMFNAATKDQKVVLEAIFGTRNKFVDVSKWAISNNSFNGQNNKKALEVKFHGTYKNKGFWLSAEYNWEIVTDDEDDLVLVPTRK